MSDAQWVDESLEHELMLFLLLLPAFDDFFETKWDKEETPPESLLRATALTLLSLYLSRLLSCVEICLPYASWSPLDLGCLVEI